MSKTSGQSILEDSISTSYRIGLTGTLQEVALDLLVLEGLFGKPFQFVTTKELIDRGQVADLRIKNIILNYSDPLRKMISSLSYQEEYDLIISLPSRMNILTDFVSSLKKNTLVLFTRIEKHGDILFEELKKKNPDKMVFYISGKNKAEEREEVRILTEADIIKMEFDDFIIEVSENVKILLSNGKFKLAKYINEEDDVNIESIISTIPELKNVEGILWKRNKKYFLETLGAPVNLKNLNEYIKFCLVMNINFETLEYTEVHHILPRSKFESFSNEKRFQVKLLYEDHVRSHILLAEAFPIKNFIYPLFFMEKTLEEKLELNELKSLSAKNWWKEIKEDNSEIYMNWVEKRSNWMKENQKPGCEFFQKVLDGVKLFWEKHPEARERVSKRIKHYWKNLTEEEYLNHCNNMKWKDSDDYESRCEKNRERYDNEDFKLKHKERMTEVNKSEEKRLSAGKKLKNLWTTPEFREKTNNGRILAKQKREDEGIILTTSATMKEKWKDSNWREYNLNQRKKKREEKKLNEAH